MDLFFFGCSYASTGLPLTGTKEAVSLYPNESVSEDWPIMMPIGQNSMFVGQLVVMQPVTTFGPGSEKLCGIQENTAVFNMMLESLGLTKTAD
ncbi:MAG: hypothetical protein ABFS17_13525 [Chloroflexota bacterium]